MHPTDTWLGLLPKRKRCREARHRTWRNKIAVRLRVNRQHFHPGKGALR